MTDIDLDRLEALAEAATPGPWYWKQTKLDINLVARTEWSPIVLGFGRWGMHGAQPLVQGDGLMFAKGSEIRVSEHRDMAFIAAAREAVPQLIAEVRQLRKVAEAQRRFSGMLGFGDGVTEPAATLVDQMADPLREAMAVAMDHDDCPVVCELCGETLAATACEKCHGSGCLPNAALAYLECDVCAGVGKVHVGCAEQSYAALTAKVAAVVALLDRVENRMMATARPDEIRKALEVEP